MSREVVIHPVKIGYVFEVNFSDQHAVLTVTMYNGKCPASSFENLEAAKEFLFCQIKEQRAYWEEQLQPEVANVAHRLENGGTPAYLKKQKLHCFSFNTIEKQSVEFHYGMKCGEIESNQLREPTQQKNKTVYTGDDLYKAFEFFEIRLRAICRTWIALHHNTFNAMLKRLTPKYCRLSDYKIRIYKLLSRERFVIPVIVPLE